jgi:DNA replication protein DnaC
MHEAAFQEWGAVPEEILYDRMKTVWLDTDERDEVIWHPVFLDFARYWGFKPRLCRPYRAQTKGKIESGVKYVRRNFVCGLLGREPACLMDFNSELRQWVETVANRRVHGTTNEQVILRWEMDRLAMQPFSGRPPYPYSDDELRKVARDAYVSWQANRYSVPWQYVGKEVWVREQANQVEVHYGGERIAVHARAARRHQVITQRFASRWHSTRSHQRWRQDSDPHAGNGARGGIPLAGGLRKPGHGRCAMTPIERLQNALTSLGLKAVDARLEGLLEQAAKKEPSYADFLDEVLACEVDARRSRYLRARLQLSHLPFVKTFDQFDFAFQPSIDERQVRELRTLRFVHEASNVILLGPPGVGKTHLSVSLAEAAIQAGFGAYFITAHDLVTDLGRAYREGRLDRRMRIYLAPKILIIDEMGYLPLDDLGATIFFQLVSARYERGSIILTSNKSYGDWGSIFGDTIIATAILDRLLHHSTTINIRGESYRLKDRRRAGLLPRPEDQQPPPAMVAMSAADAPNSRAKRSHSL